MGAIDRSAEGEGEVSIYVLGVVGGPDEEVGSKRRVDGRRCIFFRSILPHKLGIDDGFLVSRRRSNTQNLNGSLTDR